MADREQEYRELFAAEALETIEMMGRHLGVLERAPLDEPAIADSFRLLHNLKASAAATGFQAIADLAHALETLFGRLRVREIAFTGKVVGLFYEGLDALDELSRFAMAPQAGPAPDLTSLLGRLDAVTPADSLVTGASAGELVVATLPEFGVVPELVAPAGAPRMELSDLVSIPVRKLNTLLTQASELTLYRDRLRTLARELDLPVLTQLSDQFSRLAEDIQYAVMDARLVTVGSLFNKFPRVVRDVATAESKRVDLLLSGQDIQIDRNVLQIVTDGLLHLLRNAITHGIERPAERLAAGKPETGILLLDAQTDRDRVILTLTDDGRGIDRAAVVRKARLQGLLPADYPDPVVNTAETSTDASADATDADGDDVLHLIFEPGFSTASTITAYAGRGVGLDVVKLAVDTLGGRLQLTTEPGRGTTFTLVLPSSIAVKPALLVEDEDSFYAIGLTYTENVVSLAATDLFAAGPVLMAALPGTEEAVPVVALRHLLEGTPGLQRLLDRAALGPGPYPVVIVRHNNRRLGLLVGRFIGQQDIVVKPVAKPLDQIDLFNGLTTLGNGRVCVVLDVPALTAPFTGGRDARQFGKMVVGARAVPAALVPR